MNILVTGAKGQLGTHFRLLAPQSQHDWLFTDVEELDITCGKAVNDFVDGHEVCLIVNCAAYTNVDRAESDEAAAMSINADAVGIMADAMDRVGGTLMHFSTDYVFGGNPNNTPCTEQEPANPTGAYGRTKWAGEQATTRCKSLVFRTSWLYSEYGKNFLLTMLRLTAEKPELRVVFDQVGTPTYAGDLAKAVFSIIESGDFRQHEGLYHFANEGVCSWYDFAHEIARLSGHTACRILPCHSNEYPSPVKRPAYSVLDKTKFKQTFRQEIPHWTDALQRCLNNLALRDN
ncbi:MAG: dTDP-4-dehydrorhamnose reductase [Bacteroidales bacterium]|nr:dTDP-4-dehydrorhamnose reductase [Bacteroidales bacterium]